MEQLEESWEQEINEWTVNFCYRYGILNKFILDENSEQICVKDRKLYTFRIKIGSTKRIVFETSNDRQTTFTFEEQLIAGGRYLIVCEEGDALTLRCSASNFGSGFVVVRIIAINQKPDRLVVPLREDRSVTILAKDKSVHSLVFFESQFKVSDVKFGSMAKIPFFTKQLTTMSEVFAAELYTFYKIEVDNGSNGNALTRLTPSTAKHIDIFEYLNEEKLEWTQDFCAFYKFTDMQLEDDVYLDSLAFETLHEIFLSPQSEVTVSTVQRSEKFEERQINVTAAKSHLILCTADDVFHIRCEKSRFFPPNTEAVVRVIATREHFGKPVIFRTNRPTTIIIKNHSSVKIIFLPQMIDVKNLDIQTQMKRALQVSIDISHTALELLSSTIYEIEARLPNSVDIAYLRLTCKEENNPQQNFKEQLLTGTQVNADLTDQLQSNSADKNKDAITSIKSTAFKTLVQQSEEDSTENESQRSNSSHSSDSELSLKQ